MISIGGTLPDRSYVVYVSSVSGDTWPRGVSELAPYKYAGYSPLIRTIRLETDDELLFSKGAPLLAAATELCQLTLACSALNAEQLRREQGLQVCRAVVLQAYFTMTVRSNSDCTCILLMYSQAIVQ